MARRPFFSGNYGSALGSFDTAAKLIAQAGQTQGQAMANIGKQIGDTIEEYQLNKEKQKKNKASIKSQSDMLDLLGEQDKSKQAQYLALKERLNDPDVPLTERAEYGKGLMNTLTISSRMENQKILNEIRQQALDQNKKNQEDLDNALGILRDTREGLVSAIEDGSLDRNTLTGTALLLVDNPAQLALGTRATVDYFKSDPDKERERQIFQGMGGVPGAIKRTEDKFDLDARNAKSLINYRDSLTKGKTVQQTAEPDLKSLRSEFERLGSMKRGIEGDEGKVLSISELFVREPDGSLVIDEDYTSELNELTKNNAQLYVEQSRKVLNAQARQPVRVSSKVNIKSLNETPNVGDEIQFPDGNLGIVRSIDFNTGEVIYEYESNLAEFNKQRELEKVRAKKREEEIKKINLERQRQQDASNPSRTLLYLP